MRVSESVNPPAAAGTMMVTVFEGYVSAAALPTLILAASTAAMMTFMLTPPVRKLDEELALAAR